MSGHAGIVSGEYSGHELVDHVRKLVGSTDQLLEGCPICNAIIRRLMTDPPPPASPAVTRTGRDAGNA